MKSHRSAGSRAFAALLGLGLFVSCGVLVAQNQATPQFKFDADWPKPLPYKWKLGGVTGLAIDKERVQRFVPGR